MQVKIWMKYDPINFKCHMSQNENYETFQYHSHQHILLCLLSNIVIDVSLANQYISINGINHVWSTCTERPKLKQLRGRCASSSCGADSQREQRIDVLSQSAHYVTLGEKRSFDVNGSRPHLRLSADRVVAGWVGSNNCGHWPFQPRRRNLQPGQLPTCMCGVRLISRLSRAPAAVSQKAHTQHPTMPRPNSASPPPLAPKSKLPTWICIAHRPECAYTQHASAHPPLSLGDHCSL